MLTLELPTELEEQLVKAARLRRQAPLEFLRHLVEDGLSREQASLSAAAFLERARAHADTLGDSPDAVEAEILHECRQARSRGLRAASDQGSHPAG